VGSIVAGKRADFCVLQDDPFELGVERLHEVRIAGTVFEGVPHLLPRPASSSLGAALSHGQEAMEREATVAPTQPESPTGRYRPWSALRSACCGFADRCDIVRQWSAWLGAARAGATS
jgi:hypothetical protein